MLPWDLMALTIPKGALERTDATRRVALHLPEGNVYRLNGTQLHIRNIHTSLHSEGVGATLDAQGISRHFDVAPGAQLHFHRVHTRGAMTGMAHGNGAHGHGHAASMPAGTSGPTEMAKRAS